MEETDADAAIGGARPETSSHAPANAIDIEKLTERVYRLMQAELRLDRARREGASPLGKR